MALLPGRLTPLLQDQLAHLGAWMPFAKAAALLQSFTHTRVSDSTAQRSTEAVGLAYQAVQLAEVERIEHDWPEVPEGPAKLTISADGAMVPLVGGEWAEIKTVVVSEVGDLLEVEGKSVGVTHTHSYFSRLSDAESFARLSLGELTRRRVETAKQVAAVNDGAEWIGGFVAYHCPQAIRILDFPHAAERICQIGDVVLGEGSAEVQQWRTEQLYTLKHDGPNELLPKLRGFAAAHGHVPVVMENLAYLEKRLAQMQYPRFVAEGWPIGSGVVESANKLVVEARLKGAGMHWSRASVTPMLALRNAVCNDRWNEAWRESAAHIQKHGRPRRSVIPRRTSEQLAPTAPVPILTANEPAPPPSKPVHPWRRHNYATRANLPNARE